MLLGAATKGNVVSVLRTAVRSASRKPNAKYNYKDALGLHNQLTRDERKIFNAANEMCESVLLPRVTRAFRDCQFEKDLMKDLGEAGILGATIDGYGCSSVSTVSYGLIARALERVDSGYRQSVSTQSCLVMGSIHDFGTEKHRENYLPRLSKGEIIGTFGLAEPNTGSDPGGIITHARRAEGGYIINGTKAWATNAPIADVFVVWAKDLSDPMSMLRGFILERGMKGLTTPAREGQFSLRTSPIGNIIMDNVFVPEENILPGAKGYAAPYKGIHDARYAAAWGALGAAEACMEVARQYTMNRKIFGAPLASNQLVQKKLADMSTEISIGLQACFRVGRLKKTGKATPEMISMIKRNSCGKALEIARTARDMLGGNGIIDEYHVIRHMLNLELVNTYDGTSDIHALVLGNAITGMQSISRR